MPRKYVLFCGAVFVKLLRDSGLLVSTPVEHRFGLPTRGGSLTKHEYRFTSVKLRYDGRAIHAGVANSFAVQGIPMDEYGRMCHARYDGTTD